MKIMLVSPFRTLVNVHTDLALENADAFHRVLVRTAELMSAKTGAPFRTHKTAPQESAFTKYTNLDADHNTWYTKPLAEVALDAARLKALEALAEKGMPEDVAAFQTLKALRLDIFDNTFSIFTAELEINAGAARAHFAEARELEDYLTKYAGVMARSLQSEFLTLFAETLRSVARSSNKFWPHKQDLVKLPKDFVAFDDLKGQPFPKWDTAQESLLWTHRVFDMSSLAADEYEILKPLLRMATFPADRNYVMRWGTSYILKDTRTEKFMQMNIVNQYFYCMLDVLGHSQKRLLRKVVNINSDAPPQLVLSQYDRQQNLISEIENELLDYTSGLQDLNREIFDDIQESFGTRALIERMHSRAGMLKDRIQRILARRQDLTQRFLSYVLVTLGGLQIIQMTQGFFSYTRETQDDDPYFGVTDVFRVLSFDLVMNVLLIALLAGAFIWVSRRRNRL